MNSYKSVTINETGLQYNSKQVQQLKQAIKDFNIVIEHIDNSLRPLTHQIEKLKELETELNYSIRYLEERIDNLEIKKPPTYRKNQLRNEIERARRNKLIDVQKINVSALRKIKLDKKTILDDLFIWILNVVFGKKQEDYSWQGFKQNILIHQKFQQFMGLFIISSNVRYQYTLQMISKKKKIMSLQQSSACPLQIQLIISIATFAAEQFRLKQELKSLQKQLNVRYQKINQQTFTFQLQLKMKKQTKQIVIKKIQSIEPFRKIILKQKYDIKTHNNQLCNRLYRIEDRLARSVQLRPYHSHDRLKNMYDKKHQSQHNSRQKYRNAEISINNILFKSRSSQLKNRHQKYEQQQESKFQNKLFIPRQSQISQKYFNNTKTKSKLRQSIERASSVSSHNDKPKRNKVMQQILINKKLGFAQQSLTKNVQSINISKQLKQRRQQNTLSYSPSQKSILSTSSRANRQQNMINQNFVKYENIQFQQGCQRCLLF